MDFNQFLKQVLTDLKVELKDEFDRNFERKAFFDQPWDKASYPNRRGSLMMRSGNLRNSIQAEILKDGIRFFSSVPYAVLMNEGGSIVVTAQMKKYFWAMYYQASGAITKTKSGKVSQSKKNVALSAEAGFWKGMALKKIGSKIIIPARRFIGDHPKVFEAVKSVVDDNMKELGEDLAKVLKQK